MTSKIIEMLNDIESALHLVREQLARDMLEYERNDLRNIDLASLENVTPAEWKQWFTELSFPTPTEAPSYEEILPCLVVGFPPTDTIPARIEQRPYISNSSKLEQSLHIELINSIEWFTIEFLIPPAITETYNDLYFVWRANLNVPQVVGVNLYQTNEASQTTITKINKEILPSMDWTEIRSIHLNRAENIIRTRIVFGFLMDKFQSIRFDEIQLYRAVPTPGVDHS